MSAPVHKDSFVDRRVRRIAGARSVTLGLAVTLVLCAAAGAAVMRVADSTTFHSTGDAFWWALQTVTTVGYGDIVPHSTWGRIVGSVELVIGVAFVTFVTAGVTSTVLQREEQKEREADRAKLEEHVQGIVDSLAAIERRLESMEAPRS